MRALPNTELICQNLACGYGKEQVLGNVDLHLRSGEVTVLLGPNGSGKSTLLKTFTRSVAPISGDVLVNGQSFKQVSDRDWARLVAFVPQEEFTQFSFRVREVVIMGRLPYPGSLSDSQEDVAIAHEAMRKTDCSHLQDRKIESLSGGERQRVWIARALTQKAPLLLLDEPNAHLDVRHQLELLQILRELRTEGLLVLCAVHDLGFASAVADRIILLSGGRILLQGSSGEVLTSASLEQAYQVRFERLTSSSGQVALMPKELI